MTGALPPSGMPGHPGRKGGIKNNPDGSPKEPGQQYEEMKRSRTRKQYPNFNDKKTEQDDERENEEQAKEEARRQIDELNKKRATECAKAVGWGSIFVGIGIGIWEGGKWVAATAAAPETGGCSYAAAAALP
jgi:hypothetical protein